MGSFGMDWSQKGCVLWDWENLPPIGASENPKIVPQAEPKFAGVEATRHESVHSSCGTFSSSSDGSSKSSISASIDSSYKLGSNVELSFAPVKEPGKNTDLGRIDDTVTSPSSVVVVSSGEPVIGLKLGKRTYFEDACGGPTVKSSPSGTGEVTPASSVKKAKVANTQNSYCQVEGCRVDLSSAKDYHRKHKVCEAHSKAPKVVVAGLERRFCQQCSRFHALGEFDQKKRSCRRRLNDHNARRRKPQAEAISFGSSRLSAMLYGRTKPLAGPYARQQTSLLFGQATYGQMRSCASSSWDNPGSFKFAETKAPWLKPIRAASVDGMHLSSQHVWNNIMPHGPHHDFDGLTASKGISAKIHNQGVEVSTVVSNSNGAPDLQRALSLLSNNSVGAANNQPAPQLHPGLTTLASTSSPVMQAPSSGLWQGVTPLGHQERFQAFDNGNVMAPELELQKPPCYDTSSAHYDQMH
ncbi:hypothetical protein ACP70R_029577 [Stipagrostis hirtigluma subsp. patula]